MLHQIRRLYNLMDYELTPVNGHAGGRNTVYICSKEHSKRYVLRISETGDRSFASYAAETEFVHYLATNGAPVADIVLSANGNAVEQLEIDGKAVFVSVFEYAKGSLLSENGYRYREGAPLSEYFFNTGRALGKIHALSKAYVPKQRRMDYFEWFTVEYINQLLPASYAALKERIAQLLCEFRSLPQDSSCYGMVHFDFSDGNYHIDYQTGDITVFDFDNACFCWYMYDLANLWLHGEGWIRGLSDREKRRAAMNDYFQTVLSGYRSQTTLNDAMLQRLPVFINMVLIENIVDAFDCCRRDGEEVEAYDIEEKVSALLHPMDYAGLI